MRLIAFFAALAGMAVPVVGGVPQTDEWRPIRHQAVEARVVAKNSETEVMAGRGAIIVRTVKPVEVEVYTILGQLVSRRTVPAGTSQLEMPLRGVYIVRVGRLTGKVAL